MSIVENIINQITPANGISKPQGFNLDDDTFAKLLMKASAVSPTEETNNLFSQLGAPAGFEIEDFNAEPKEAPQINPTEQIEIKDLQISENYFSSLLNDNSNAMNMAKRHAANAYNIFSKNFVDTLGEFISDTAPLVSKM